MSDEDASDQLTEVELQTLLHADSNPFALAASRLELFAANFGKLDRRLSVIPVEAIRVACPNAE